MVELISRLGGLFGSESRKKAVSGKKAVKAAKKGKKPAKAAKKSPPAAVHRAPAAAKRTEAFQRPVPTALGSVVLFTKPSCADCEEAKRLVASVRRVVHGVSFLEVDVSTKPGEVEALLSGVVQTPSFVINGRPVFRGVLPSREQLARVINEGIVK